MIKVSIIGNGNVASHLINAFTKAPEIEVEQINSRNIKNKLHSDVSIIAVSDGAIAEVSSKINNGLVVHTSGSVPMSELKNNGNKGVFYLLQSFTKNSEVDFSSIPFCIETENKNDLQLLETLAKSIGNKIYFIDSEQRKKIHLAAVFVNNFVNHLYDIGFDICKDNSIPFEILKPLIKETAQKVQSITPNKAQTGPAQRNDQQTIQDHLELLNTHQQKIYTLLTNSIQSSFSNDATIEAGNKL